jgi:glucose-1-phosphate adenylyltransferase
MLLAGGQGERLYPLTRDRAKPAVPFGGLYRIIDFTLSNCVNSNLRKIYILTQYKSDSLNKHLRLGWNIYHEELDEFITTVPPQFRSSDYWYKGTADAIFQNIYTLQEERPERVLILAGDHIYRMDYGQMLQFHEDNQADLTVAAVEMDLETAQGFGVMSVDTASQIVEFVEKPERPTPHPERPDKALVSMGIYVFNTDQLVRAVIEDARKNSTHDFGRDIVPKLIRTHRVFAYLFRDGEGQPQYWRDVGTIDSYWETNMDLLAVNPVFNLYDPGWPFRTYHGPSPPAKMVFADEQNGRVGTALESLISNGCIISGGRVQRSVLSPKVHVHSYAQVSESILMEGVDVGRYARIRRAIIDKGVHIPPGYEIGYDLEADRKKFLMTEKGIVVIPKEMILDHRAESGTMERPEETV